MRLQELEIDGFGKLANRTLTLNPRFNVVYGPNEAGKSTLGAALVASLYGLGRGDKERYRPWSGARYATRLTYALADGRRFEVQRDYERDAKGVRIYDAAGNDASGACSIGRIVSPGHAHLGVPLEVFVNAAYTAQGDTAIDGNRADRITHSLARALDGGPREDAAIGALGRLDAALATHVGTKRATVNAPLRHLYDEIAQSQTRADDMRASLLALADLRKRLEYENASAREREEALNAAEARGRSIRCFTLHTRLDALRQLRDDRAALAVTRARYDDAVDCPAGDVAALESLFHDLRMLEALADAHEAEAARTSMHAGTRAELDATGAAGGTLDDAAFARLEAAAAHAAATHRREIVAADELQSAQRTLDGGNVVGGAFAATIFVALGAGALVFAKLWLFAALVAIVAGVLAIVTVSLSSRRRTARRSVSAARRAAQNASADARAAGDAVARLLEPLGVATVADVARQRARSAELQAQADEAARSAARATAARERARTTGEAFDGRMRGLVTPTGVRERDLAAVRACEARRNARDGIDLQRSMLDVRQSDVLGTDDPAALEAELAELVAAGVEPVAGDASTRAFEAERATMQRLAHESRVACAATAAELRTAEAAIGDLAELDERVARARARAARLEAFEAAVTLARETIDARTRETHQTFATRLADYASRTFARVSGDRYRDLRVDPTTLAVRVRVPETGEIVDVDRLSAGTREQAYLVTRLAMVRMFAEGLETAPILLDDPFAFWDDARIERCLPILDADLDTAQVVVFTTSLAFARAALRRGAQAIDLSLTDDVARTAVRALDGDEDLSLLAQP